MMMNKKVVVMLMLVGVSFLSGSRVSAQTATEQEIELLRKDIRSQKKELIALNLSLTAKEGTSFWPVYDK
jgi:cell division protein FtsL